MYFGREIRAFLNSYSPKVSVFILSVFGCDTVLTSKQDLLSFNTLVKTVQETEEQYEKMGSIEIFVDRQ